MSSSWIPNVTYSSLSGNETLTEEELDNFDFALYHIVVPILFGMITCMGTIGNSLVIYVILSQERMRTVTNIMLLNLAFADLCFVLVIPPFTAYTFASNVWPFGEALCKLMHFLVNVTAYVTVYTLVLISAVRYLIIVHGARTGDVQTRNITISIIISIWLVMVSLNIPVLLAYGARIRKNDEDGTEITTCDLYEDGDGLTIFLTFFIFAYILPFTVIALLSARILCAVVRPRRGPIPAGVKRTKSFRKKRQVGRMLILVVALFAVLWLPVHVHLLVWFIGHQAPTRLYRTLGVAWQCLAYFNSCVNPIIYNRTSEDFRNAFREAVGCKTINRNGDLGDGDSEIAVSRVTRPRNIGGKDKGYISVKEREEVRFATPTVETVVGHMGSPPRYRSPGEERRKPVSWGRNVDQEEENHFDRGFTLSAEDAGNRVSGDFDFYSSAGNSTAVTDLSNGGDGINRDGNENVPMLEMKLFDGLRNQGVDEGSINNSVEDVFKM